jgi:hypothetical protein
MIRFSTKSLILLTTVVAIYGLMVHAVTRGQGWICLGAFVLYLVLLRVVIRQGTKAENAYNERAKRAREANESNLTT